MGKGRKTILISGFILIFIAGTMVSGPQVIAANPVLEEIRALLLNDNFGLKEIKNEVRNIENRQTNEILGPAGDYVQPVVLSLQVDDSRSGVTLSLPVELAGEMLLRWTDPVPDPVSGERVIQTEMVSMSLTGFHPQLGDIKVDIPIPAPGELRIGPPGSDFQVDSFFDITYRIEYTGAPGGALAGLGQTSAPIRQTPDPDYPWTIFPPPELPLREENPACYGLVGVKGVPADFGICFIVLTPTTQPTLMIKKELIQLEKKIDALPLAPVCGNQICESGEDTLSCPTDCPIAEPVCGNNICEIPVEDADTCIDDCNLFCGDGVCQFLESEFTCPADCLVIFPPS